MLNSKSIDLIKVFPIQEVRDMFLVNGNGDITVAVKLKHSQVFSQNAEDLERDLETYMNLLKLLPSNTIVHKQDYYTTGSFYEDYKFGDLVTIRDNKAYYNKKPVVKHESYIYLTFITQNKKKENPIFTQPDYILKKPFGLLEFVTEDLDRKVTSFVNNLQAIESILEVELLKESKLNQLLFKYSSLDKTSEPIIDCVPAYKAETTGLKIGNKNVSVISLLEEGALVYYTKPAH